MVPGMDLEDRLRLRDLLLGDDHREHDLKALLLGEHADPAVRRLVAEVQPLLAQLEEIADLHVPVGTPREAVQYVLGRASGFRLSSVAEYCGHDERYGSSIVTEVQRLLAGEVQAGRLEISYLFSCPSCGNVIDYRDKLPEEPFQTFCEHGNCQAERTVDPAKADAVFINASRDPALENWL
jgi:hypothetical protein